MAIDLLEETKLKKRKMRAKVLVLGFLFLPLSLLWLQLEEEEKLSKVEREIKAISDIVAKFISIPVVEDDGSMYRIWVVFLFEPRNYDQVQPWTDTVCRAAKRILDNNDVVRDIEVWAIRIIGFSWEEGGVLFYGRTFYDHDTDKFEFKNIRELNIIKKEKRAVELLEQFKV